MAAIALVNNHYCELEDARISVLDRGLVFGDAIYEVLRVNNSRAFRVKDHFERMKNGLTALEIPLPFDDLGFEELIRELIARNQIGSGTIYMQVSRGEAMRSHVPPAGLNPNVFAFMQQGGIPTWKDHPQGVGVITVEDFRWHRCNLKTTMLLANTLAKRKAKTAGAFEAIFLSPDGIVREGSSTNIFAVIDKALCTHPNSPHILPGVTRNIVLSLARLEGIPVVERGFNTTALLEAEEIFLTGTNTDVCPVIAVDGKAAGSGRSGAVTNILMNRLARLLEEETR